MHRTPRWRSGFILIAIDAASVICIVSRCLPTMSYITKVAIASIASAVAAFAVAYAIEWPTWREHDRQFQEQIAWAREAMRRGEDPFAQRSFVLYCGLTPLQTGRIWGITVLMIAPTVLLAAGEIWHAFGLNIDRSQ